MQNIDTRECTIEAANANFSRRIDRTRETDRSCLDRGSHSGTAMSNVQSDSSPTVQIHRKDGMK